MDAIFERHDRIAAIREFGPNRVLDGINRLYRVVGLDMLTDDAQQALLDRLEADWRFAERLNAENRAIRAAPNAAETDRIVAEAHARQMEGLIAAVLFDKPATPE